MVRRGKDRPRPEEKVKSPCIGQCFKIDFDNSICLGCFRSIDEIGDWWSMDDESRKEVLGRCKERAKESRRKTK